MSKTTDTATYTKCPECGWWLQPTDDHCTDCGRLRRQPRVKEDCDEDVVVGVGVVGVVVGSVGGLVVGNVVGDVVGDVVGVVSLGVGVVGVVVGSVGGLVVGWINARRRAARARLPFRAPTFLRQREARLQGQVEALKAEQERLQSLHQRIANRLRDLQQRGQPVGALPAALQALEEALAARVRQVQRCRVTQHSFALVRWRNQLEPLLQDPSQADPDAVSPLAQQGRERLSALESEGLTDTPEGNRLAAQWRREIEDCEALENDLLAYQTLCAVKSVRPLAEEAPRDDLERHLAAFSQREYLGELEAGLLELEEERQRLTGEEEALAEVENLLR